MKRKFYYKDASEIYKDSYISALKRIDDLKKEINLINLKRNAKGQFERRAK